MYRIHPVFLYVSCLLFFVCCGVSPFAAHPPLINEIYYNPPDELIPAEFIELFNPTGEVIDLSEYAFTDGIRYIFPAGTTLAPGGYLLLVQDPSHASWRNNPAPVLGPYLGQLSNSGETIRLRAENGDIIETIEYRESAPWPRSADGYGSSLERITSEGDSNDPIHWRGSLVYGGSPGWANTTLGTPVRPILQTWMLQPGQPESADEVEVHIWLDAEEETVRSVSLQYELVTAAGQGSVLRQTMRRVENEPTHFAATIPAQPSQTLVRWNIRVLLFSGDLIYLPHPAEPRPYESYFVYNHEIPRQIPLLWMYDSVSSSLTSQARPYSAIVVNELGSKRVLVFDGVEIRDSQADGTGRKVKFLKGEEYMGDRTINISPEWPTHPNSGGPDTNHKEHIAFRLFRDFGVMAPRCDWYRVIEKGQHSQRTATQQPNERFLEQNSRDSDSNIYKIAYNEPYAIPGMSIRYSKKTNLDEDSSDLFEMMDAIRTPYENDREAMVRKYLDIERCIAYSVAGVLLTNWDGFFNNMFLIHNPPPFERWECVPWDLDKTFGYTDGYPPHSTTFAEMPLEFPLNGRSPMAGRDPGPVSRPLHRVTEFHERYLQQMGQALNGLFSIERMTTQFQEAQDLLLEDLRQEAQYTGIYRTRRESQIRSAYQTMETYLHLRHEFLRPLLHTPVTDWVLH